MENTKTPPAGPDDTLSTDGGAPFLTIQLGEIGGLSLEPEDTVPVLDAILIELSRLGKVRLAKGCQSLINSLEGKHAE